MAAVVPCVVLALLWLPACAAAQVKPPVAEFVQPLALVELPEADRLAPQPIEDDRGRTVHLARPPVRIVSLLPSLTESVCALGLCTRLVGVDRYSDWPPTVQKLPVLGGGLDPSIEAIVALKPDLVLLSPAAKVAERLQALGIPVVALEVRSQADVHQVLQQLGLLLGVPAAQGAERVWRDLQTGLAAAARLVPEGVQHARVYFEVSRGYYAAGPQSFIGEILAQLGADNVVPAALGPFPRLSAEFLLRAQPDVILMSSRSMPGASSRPGWRSLAAVRAGHVCVFSEQASNIIVRPSPRMAEAAHLIAQCLADKAPRRTAPR